MAQPYFKQSKSILSKNKKTTGIKLVAFHKMNSMLTDEQGEVSVIVEEYSNTFFISVWLT